MFSLYNKEVSQALARNFVNVSAETRIKHEAALNNNKGEDIKCYKKENKGDHSLLKFGENLAVIVGPFVGLGSFARVKKGITSAGECVAVKCIFFDPTCALPSQEERERKLIREDFWAEIEVLKIKGQYRGHRIRKTKLGEKGYILSAFHAGVDLDELPTEIELDVALHILIGILNELNQLLQHNPPYLHNDLKSSNIKVNLNNRSVPEVKLVDFGASRQCGKPSATATFKYTAPEILADCSLSRTVATEIYSFGKVAAELYRTINTKQESQKKELGDIIRLCISPEPIERPNIEKLIDKFNALLKKLVHNHENKYSKNVHSQMRREDGLQGSNNQRKGCCKIL